MKTCDRPLFNYLQCPNVKADGTDFKGVYGGQQMQVFYIEDMPKLQDDCKIWAQMCKSGYRMTKDNFDISEWNLCTFEDIDYKKYYKDIMWATDPLKVYEDLWVYLKANYNDIIYYSELSRSGKAFHFIFYFNVSRSENNWKMCKAASTYMIKKAMIDCGYSEALEYKGVYDTCTDSFYQMCYMTLNKHKINDECTGAHKSIFEKNYYSIKEEYDRLYNKKLNSYNKSSYKRDDKWSINFKIDDMLNNKEIPYLNHHERYYLFCSLSGLCGDDDALLQELWERCARMLPEGNGHTTSYYIKVPYYLDWSKKRTGSEYVNKELLNMFGVNVNIFKNSNYENNITKKAKQITKKRVYI